MLGMQIYKPIFLTLTAAIPVSVFTISASAQEVDAKTLLEQMSAENAGLDNFIVSGDAYADARLACLSYFTTLMREQPLPS